MFKRFLPLLLTLMVVVAGCSGAAKPSPGPIDTPKPAPKPIDAKEAAQVLEQYLDAKIARNVPKMQELVVPELRETQGPGTSNPHMFQYGIGQPTPTDKGVSLPTTEFQRYTSDKLFSQVDMLTYVVVQRDNKLLVDTAERLGLPDTKSRISIGLSKSAPPQLLISRGNGQSVTVRMEDLPNAFRPYGAPAGTEFGVGKQGFGSAAAGPTYAAFVTQGTHPFLGIVELSSGKITGLDLWYGGAAGEMAWSPDGRWLAAAAGRPSGAFELQVWDPVGAKKVEIKGLPTGPDVQVSDFRWKKGILHFRMNNQDWTFDPATGEAKKA